MRILFDQGTPAPLRRALSSHAVETAFDKGWGELLNGELLQAAESEGFALFVTTDKNLGYQQNLSGRRIAILVLWTTSWPEIERSVATVVAAVGALKLGEFRELSDPADASGRGL